MRNPTAKLGAEWPRPNRWGQAALNGAQMLCEDPTGILPIDEGVAQQWGEMTMQIPKGQHTGGNDSWIAATALTHELILLTSDPDFDAAPGLQKENWLS